VRPPKPPKLAPILKSYRTDLKPENLLFRGPEEDADLLIADFGLSRIMDDERITVLTTTCGT
jgi:serine/threonine protein kinase